MYIKDTIYKIGDYYGNTKELTYTIRLGSLYSQKSKDKPRAPVGITRKILCNLILKLITTCHISIDDVILLEADPSENGKLIKMYESMSFVNEGYDISINKKDYKTDDEYLKAIRDRGAVMITTIRNLLKWHHNKYTPYN